ncbi:terminase large subunit domain-containing protein [Vitreoscilla filiformis]|nr:terminase family protein [Vitreoscilla filiformis]
MTHPAQIPAPLSLLAPGAADDAPPPVLLAYQQRWLEDSAQLKVMEKSRRTGMTWAEAADNVLIAASEGGSNVFYISANHDMAREYIEAVAMWAKAFSYVASQIGEGIFDDGKDPTSGQQRLIKTYEVSFPATGRRIVALSSRPNNLRGKQGVIVIDEAAFAPDLAALLKAALAMLLWGDKVRIISTHDGADNPFNELIQDIRAGKRGPPTQANVHRVTFDEAVEAGLYKRVCLRKGLTYTPEAEKAWADGARKLYGDGAAEELDVIPSNSGSRYLSLELISQRMTAPWPAAPTGPVIIRKRWGDGFAFLPEDVRTHAVAGWLAEFVTPHLRRLNPQRPHALGQDFARSGHLSVIAVGEEGADLIKRVRLVLELGNAPFSVQRQILWHIIDHLPRWRGAALDASGNGSEHAEAAAQRYGAMLVEGVKFTAQFYLANMPKLKAGLEDGTLDGIPRDEHLRDDLRSFALDKRGVPVLPEETMQSAGARAAAAEGGGKGQKRHGDFAIALLLLVYAFAREVGEIDFIPLPATASAWAEQPEERRRDGPGNEDDWHAFDLDRERI